MGKNPNANREKRSKHKERSYDNDLEEVAAEAARLGCEVWEVEKYQKLERGDASDSEEEHDSQKEDKDFDKVADKK